MMMMLIMMNKDIKEEWSIWTAFVRFREGFGGKVRPVIVLEDNIVLCLCIGVTSQEKCYRNDYKLKHWEHAGLKKESWVVPEYLELGQNKFKRRIGMLHPDDIQCLKEWVRDLSN